MINLKDIKIMTEACIKLAIEAVQFVTPVLIGAVIVIPNVLYNIALNVIKYLK